MDMHKKLWTSSGFFFVDVRIFFVTSGIFLCKSSLFLLLSEFFLLWTFRFFFWMSGFLFVDVQIFLCGRPIFFETSRFLSIIICLQRNGLWLKTTDYRAKRARALNWPNGRWHSKSLFTSIKSLYLDKIFLPRSHPFHTGSHCFTPWHSGHSGSWDGQKKENDQEKSTRNMISVRFNEIHCISQVLHIDIGYSLTYKNNYYKEIEVHIK